MKKMILKKANFNEVKGFFKKNKVNSIQGTKLRALKALIDKYGEPIEAVSKGHERFLNEKALNIGGGFYIVMKVTSINKDSFYPCKIDSIFLDANK